MTLNADDRPWLNAYPPGVPAEIDSSPYGSLVDLMDESFRRYAERVAFHFMGQDFTYAQIEGHVRALTAYFQSLGLQRGDRVALMMPNMPQYPIAVAAVLRAGMVVVNVNPLYTARELEHQLRDSGAKAMVVIENFASTLEQCLSGTAVKHIVLCTMGDMLPWPKRWLVNAVVRHARQLVPPFSLPGAVGFRTALHRGAGRPLVLVPVSPRDVALLQYTGGTTGVSKGAVLLHCNVVANVLQAEAWNSPVMDAVPANEQITSVCVLPLYHIFAFTVSMMLNFRNGGRTLLLPNPRDLSAVLKALRFQVFHSISAVNTLFAALLNHPAFDTVNWRHLKVSIGGGMAVQASVAQRWLERTGCPILEGYGLSETSPTLSCNPATSQMFSGTIGVPLPSTWMKCVDDAGQDVSVGMPGEIVVRGPQVMAGYWQRPEETIKVLSADGWLRTGDIGVMDERGYFRIVDRKKDMILVSGFNVYPNEVEEVVSGLDGVRECAVVGVPDDHSGEAVKLVVVRQSPAITAEHVRDYCKSRLTGYKQPKVIEFRDELPKTPVGKVLRRELRQPLPH